MNTNQIFNLIPNGENFAKANCPELYRMLQSKPILRTTLNNVSESKSQDKQGLQDTTEIQNIFLDKANKTLQVNSIAGFREKKGVIAIVSEVFDSATGESIKGAAVTTNDSNSLLCNIDSKLNNYKLSNDSSFFVRTIFYWTETDINGETIINSHEERKNSGIIYNEEKDIVENITIEAPNTLKPRESTIALYNRTAVSHVDDPDIVYPNILTTNNKLPFFLPFKGSVKLGKGTIIGVDKEASIIKLQHPEKQTSVNFNKDKDNNWKDIKWEYLNGNTILKWTFPENWKNELDLKDLSVNSIFNFYACLSLKVKVDNLIFPISIYMGSDIENDSTHCKVKKVFLQWGCLGKDTQIMMGDYSYKRISEIQIGDLINTGKGRANIYNIFSGYDAKIINIETETGKRISLTDGHPILTARGWVRAGNLNAADIIINCEGGKEALRSLFVTDYGDRTYNLQLDGYEHQLIAEGMVVGDFMMQNSTLESEKIDSPSTNEFEALASEFQILIEEINRNMNKKN